MAVYSGTSGPDTHVGTDGDDQLSGNGGNDVLDGAAGKDRLFGGTGNDVLTGGLGNDTLDGGTGDDRMIGGAGNDEYWIDSAGDIILEALDGGEDTVITTIDYVAGANIENALVATGTGRSLTGNALANHLSGNIGADILDGLGGADLMEGAGGNDVYHVDDRGDVVIEYVSQGIDTVYASVNFQMGRQAIENLVLEGTASIDGTGNALDNVITGNAGINTLTGGAGNDTYYIQNVGDRVIENAGEGTDTIISSVGYDLAGQYVENITLTGTADGNSAGNSLNNIMIGNDGANILRGFAGNDNLHGGLGSDYLAGGAGADNYFFETALGANNIDVIGDFDAYDDTIYLDRSVFTAINADGTLKIAGFGYLNDPTTPSARIIYDPATGKLFYDADGAGTGQAIQFATLPTGLHLFYDNFVAYS